MKLQLYSEIPRGHAFPTFEPVTEEGYESGELEPVPDLENEDADPDGGCNCGHNCDRGSGDDCPLDVLNEQAKLRDLTRARINRIIIVPGHVVEKQIHRIWADHGFEVAWNFICLFGPRRR